MYINYTIFERRNIYHCYSKALDSPLCWQNKKSTNLDQKSEGYDQSSEYSLETSQLSQVGVRISHHTNNVNLDLNSRTTKVKNVSQELAL